MKWRPAKALKNKSVEFIVLLMPCSYSSNATCEKH